MQNLRVSKSPYSRIFYVVEVKIRQNIGQMCETSKNKDMSRLFTRKAAYSKDVSSRVRSNFIILMQYQNKYC